MKTKEEIEQLAAREYWNSNTESRSFIKGYTQCQEDMADKKYTDEDMIKFAFDTYCYISGIMKVTFNQVSENRTHAEDNLKVFINSLKQD